MSELDNSKLVLGQFEKLTFFLVVPLVLRVIDPLIARRKKRLFGALFPVNLTAMHLT